MIKDIDTPIQLSSPSFLDIGGTQMVFFVRRLFETPPFRTDILGKRTRDWWILCETDEIEPSPIPSKKPSLVDPVETSRKESWRAVAIEALSNLIAGQLRDILAWIKQHNPERIERSSHWNSNVRSALVVEPRIVKIGTLDLVEGVLKDEGVSADKIDEWKARMTEPGSDQHAGAFYMVKDV